MANQALLPIPLTREEQVLGTLVVSATVLALSYLRARPLTYVGVLALELAIAYRVRLSKGRTGVTSSSSGPEPC